MPGPRPAAPGPRGQRPHFPLSCRAGVRLVPALAEEGDWELLRQLRIDWPVSAGGSALPDTVSALKEALGRSPCATACEPGLGTAALPEDVVCKVHLKSFVEQQGLVGYDPNLDVLLGEPQLWCDSGGVNGGKQACFLFSSCSYRK